MPIDTLFEAIAQLETKEQIEAWLKDNRNAANNVTQRNRFNHTPLLHAFLKEKNEDFLKVLYTHEFSVLGTSPWHNAAKDDHVELMESIWNLNMHYSIRDGINGKDKQHRTPLHIACYSGSYRVVNFLVSRVSNVNARDRNGNTALHLCTENRSLKCAKILINCAENPVDLEVQNKQHNTFLHNIIRQNSWGGHEEELVELAVNREVDKYHGNIYDQKGRTSFHLAIARGKLKAVEQYLKGSPALLEQMTLRGQSPLWLCTSKSDLYMLKYLLTLNPEIDGANDSVGTTALWLAVYQDWEEGVETLLLHGAGLESISRGGVSILHLALIRDNPFIMNMIFQKSSNSYFEMNSIKITYNKLTEADRPDLEKCLAKRDEDGNTLLHIAVQSNWPRMVEMVLEEGGKSLMRTTNEEGFTPSMLAQELRNLTILSLLGIEAADNCDLEMVKTSRRFPKFDDNNTSLPEGLQDPNGSSFKERPDEKGYISMEAMRGDYVLHQKALSFSETDSISKGQATLSSTMAPKMNNSQSNDPVDRVYTAVLLYLAYIEAFMNEHELFRRLRPCFVPVGSVIEGTKLGRPDELDFMVIFQNLDGIISVGENAKVVLNKGHREDGFLLEYFQDGYLNFFKVFVNFLTALGDAAKHVKMPKSLSKFKHSEKNCDCQDEETGIFVQCQHCLPVVTHTKVGAALNLLWEAAPYQNMVITVDLVPMFKVGLSKQHDHLWLRQEIVRNLVENRPLGWNSYMFKFLNHDRFFINQVNLASETDKLYVGIKMLSHQGNFTLRPGLNMFVEEMMNNSTLKNVYIFLKLLKLMSDAKIKSFGLKKVLSDCLLEKKRNRKKDVKDWELMKAVLDHHEMKDKFSSIHPALEEMGYAKVEFADYIKSEGDFTYIHCVTCKIIQLYTEMAKKNNEKVLELIDEAGTLTNDSYEGNPPLCAAIKNGVDPEVLKRLIDKCDVDVVDYLHQTPLLLASESGHHGLVQKILSVSQKMIDFMRKGDMATPILIAASNGHYECVRTLINHGAELNTISIDGRTPLHHAATAKEGNVETVRFLLLGKSSVDRKSIVLNTPLHDAAKAGHYHTVDLLLMAGAAVNVQNDDGDTPLHFASKEGHTEVIRRLINDQKVDINLVSSEGNTPLHYACQMGHYNSVDIVLDHGADANAKNSNGEAPMHVASSKGHVKSIQSLVRKGARTDTLDDKGNTAVHLAAGNGFVLSLNALLDKDGSLIDQTNEELASPLHLACQRGQASCVKALLDKGAAINIMTDGQLTPLHQACQSGSARAPKCTQILIEAGADIEASNRRGHTPLQWACLYGSIGCAKLLIDNGANVNSQDVLNFTPLHKACRNSHPVCVEFLLKAEANPSLARFKCMTPLHEACWFGSFECMKLLVRARADIDARNMESQTPLHLACRNNHTLCAKYLIVECEADTSLLAKGGMTPFLTACDQGSMGAASLLLMLGREPDDVTDGMGNTALHLAVENSHDEVVEMLIKSANINLDTANQAGLTPLQIACEKGWDGCLSLLVKRGANTNVLTPSMDTPLHQACTHGFPDCVQILIEFVQDFESTNADGNTAMHCASKRGDGQVIIMLLDKGELLSSRNNEGRTPLHLACEHGQALCAQILLVRRGADIGAMGRNGETPLHLASFFGHLNCVQALLSAGAKINARASGSKNQTPLFWACNTKTAAGPCVQLLCSHGDININQTDTDGNTAVHVAAKRGNANSLEMLIRFQAQLEWPNLEGDTPLHLASYDGHNECVELLLRAAVRRNRTNLSNQTPMGIAAHRGMTTVLRSLNTVYPPQINALPAIALNWRTA